MKIKILKKMGIYNNTNWVFINLVKLLHGIHNMKLSRYNNNNVGGLKELWLFVKHNEKISKASA